LKLRITKLTLVGYFGYGSYKLLNYAIESVYNIRNVIFEKDTMKFTTNTMCVEWNDDNDLMLVYIILERLVEVQVTGQYNNRDGKTD